MATSQRTRIPIETSDDLSKIPGFDAAYDLYASVLSECLSEVTVSIKEAPRNDGVPRVKDVMDKYEGRLGDLYAKLSELVEENRA